MPTNPNKLSQFWQELKRRKVTRVITVYAAAAFVILQLVEILEPSLRLPEWTMNFILVLLIVGFIITVIFSWIYDIHPEGGMVKTEPVDKGKAEDIPKSSNGWKIASYVSFVVIVGLIVLNILPRANNKKILDKSIAVLPFRNDSPDQERMYFINGTMEAILDNLCKIEDLRVPGRTSVEQYRDNPKPIPVVAEEMNVSYVLEGSGHRDGNNVRLFVQLLDGKNDQHLWSKSYDTDIEEIFSMQSEIAQLVAAEIEAIITPEENQLIEKKPTTNLTAYDFYLQGEDELWDYWINHDHTALNRAKERFNKALDYDSTYAQAFVGLGHVYWQSNQSLDEFLSENYMDSVLYYASKALSYDNQLASAYTLRGSCFIQRQLYEKAIEELDKAAAINPNYSEVYEERGRLYYVFLNDNVLSLFNYHKAAELIHGKELPVILKTIGDNYISVGFKERGMQFYQQTLELDGDSAAYYHGLSMSKWLDHDFEGIRDLQLQSINPDTPDFYLMDLAYTYLILGEYEESMHYWQMLLEEDVAYLDFFGLHMLGYTYWKLGNHEKANYYYDKSIEIGTLAMEMGGPFELFTSWSLAAVYAFRGDKTKALEYLKRSLATTLNKIVINQIISDPSFGSIRDEPEFQQIVRDVEAKYQTEHERVRAWLEDNDML